MSSVIKACRDQGAVKERRSTCSTRSTSCSVIRRMFSACGFQTLIMRCEPPFPELNFSFDLKGIFRHNAVYVLPTHGLKAIGYGNLQQGCPKIARHLFQMNQPCKRQFIKRCQHTMIWRE